MKSNFLIDKPIENKEQDLLGRENFVKNLAKDICGYKLKDNLVLGLYGAWGEGKTSILNLLENEILELEKEKKKREKTKIIKFNPWNFKDQDELIKLFFNDFYLKLKMVDINEELKICSRALNGIVSVFKFLQFIPGTSPYATIIAPLIKQYSGTLNDISSKKSLEDIKNKISNKLSKLDSKLLIYIDDVDRLNDKEITQIFQLVKLLANFPNVIYVLPFDEKVVISALKNSQKEFAEKYLEKIVNIPLKIPEISKSNLYEVLINELNSCVEDLEEFDDNRRGAFSVLGFKENFTTVRDINRFISLFRISYMPLKKEVDFFDFVIIRLLETKYKDVYNFVKQNKSVLCGNFYDISGSIGYEEDFKRNIESKINQFKYSYGDNFEFINNALSFLFPKYRTVFNQYSLFSPAFTFLDLGIFNEKKFDLYFTLNLSEDDISNELILKVLNEYNNTEIQDTLKKIDNRKVDVILSKILKYIAYKDNKFDRKEVLLNACLAVIDDIYSEQTKPFYFSNQEYVANMILEILTSVENKTEFLLTLFIKYEISYPLIYVMNTLRSDIKKEGSKIEENEYYSVESTVVEKSKELMENYSILNNNSFIHLFYLLKDVDNTFVKEWIGKLSNDASNVKYYLEFIIKLVIKGNLIDYNMTTTYMYNIEQMKELIDIDKTAEVIKKQLKEFKNKKEKYNILVAFLMFSENNNLRDSTTIKEIENYKIKNKL